MDGNQVRIDKYTLIRKVFEHYKAHDNRALIFGAEKWMERLTEKKFERTLKKTVVTKQFEKLLNYFD